MSPILPISPQLFPNIHTATAGVNGGRDSRSISSGSSGNPQSDDQSVPSDMASLDLGAAAVTLWWLSLEQATRNIVTKPSLKHLTLFPPSHCHATSTLRLYTCPIDYIYIYKKCVFMYSELYTTDYVAWQMYILSFWFISKVISWSDR
jgi:hypothetical protein